MEPWIDDLLARITRIRIGVIGDFCLDVYWTLDDSLSVISAETGLATRPVRAQRCSLGGAGNVAANLSALNVAGLRVFGVRGSDAYGREMARLLDGIGADQAGLGGQEEQWDTPVYVRPLEGDAEQSRFDLGSANALGPGTGDRLLAALRGALPDMDLVVINQQLPRGIHTEAFRAALTDVVRGAVIPFICDSRHHGDAYPGTMRKINDSEALRLAGVDWESALPVPRAEAEKAVETLYARWGTSIFVTRGARGMLVRDSHGMHEVPGLQILGRIDPVGAGDAALASIAASLAAGADPLSAGALGNLAAAVTVKKLFVTGTASPEEIRAMGESADYVHHPELAEDSRRARFLPDTEIEVVGPVPPEPVPRPTHAIFDNDGTISTLREGWERIMEPVMVRAILGPGWKSAEETLFQAVTERVHDYVEKTTGMQTLAQMHGLVEMVQEFAVVPASDVNTADGYKDLYGRELQAMVSGRVDKLSRGELSVEDVTVKGAIPFLKALYDAGVKLHIASGADENDLLAEADALGHRGLFQGRIHGAVGDLNADAKRIVLEKILAEIGLHGARALVTFGDGPVEMRETRKRGGRTVGVASDELRRYGWNMKKRARLIRAGAELVVADFSQWRTLCRAIGVPAPAP